MTSKRILWVDNNIFAFLNAALEALRVVGYHVDAALTVDEALVFLDQATYDLIIWEGMLMVPGGARFKIDSAALAVNEFACGHAFYHDMRRRFPKVPMILLTTMTHTLQPEYHRPKEYSHCLCKRATMPAQLVKEVQRILAPNASILPHK